jgi:hypothetical protein
VKESINKDLQAWLANPCLLILPANDQAALTPWLASHFSIYEYFSPQLLLDNGVRSHGGIPFIRRQGHIFHGGIL